MEKDNFRVILLTHGGAEKVLAELLKLDNVQIVGVFVETETTPQRSFSEKFKRSLRYDGYPETLTKFAKKLLPKTAEKSVNGNLPSAIWQKVEDLARANEIPVHFVKNYHLPEAIELISRADADLGVICGTNIVKETVFGVPKLGSINLHQADARTYRGGPPIFWELFNDEKEVGVTVHYVAAKVDAGDIILQKSFPLKYDFAKYGVDYESFITDFRAGFRQNCAELVAEAVKLVRQGTAHAIKQDTSQGKRYRLPLKREKDEMLRRLQTRGRAGK